MFQGKAPKGVCFFFLKKKKFTTKKFTTKKIHYKNVSTPYSDHYWRLNNDFFPKISPFFYSVPFAVGHGMASPVICHIGRRWNTFVIGMEITGIDFCSCFLLFSVADRLSLLLCSNNRSRNHFSDKPAEKFVCYKLNQACSQFLTS